MCLELAGLGVDDLGPIDLYSCFPSAVELTMAELGIDESRTVTTTGGLSFFGGPMNSYVLHAIASTVEQVREGERPGLVQGNGGYVTKQSFCVYGIEPPAAGFALGDAQDAIDRHPRRFVDEHPEGRGRIDSYTVLFGREGPERALLTALLPDGRRALASTRDPAVIEDMTNVEYVGRQVDLRPDGEAEGFPPS